MPGSCAQISMPQNMYITHIVDIEHNPKNRPLSWLGSTKNATD